ncbi:MAG: Planctomycete cytochrome, partial [Armatimonadetes bacterium]|nr:Planctomycete cytochrome [Armatimonadota bacterium]
RLVDFASPDAHAAQRYTTTVPLQALFLLNSPFMESSARALAERSAAPGSEPPPAERVRSLYRLALARDPTPGELQRGMRFAEGGAWAELAQVLLLSNEFAFVD